VRTRCAGNRLDLINLKDPKVRQPGLKTKQRIVISGKMSRHALSRDGTVEHRHTLGPSRLVVPMPKLMIRRVKASITTMTLSP